MAFTNLDALGAAIRGKVDEEDKKTLPELTEIVNSLIKPVGSQTFTENGTYDVTELAEVVVNCDVRTEEDEKNAELASAWNDFFKGETGQFSLGSIKSFTGKVPLIDAHNATSFKSAFSSGKATEYVVNVGEVATDFRFMFLGCKNLVTAEIIGSMRNATTFEEMFYDTPNLKEVKGTLDFTAVTNVSDMFRTSNFANVSLEEVRFEPNSLKISMDLRYCNKLSVNSIISVLNGLANLSGLNSQKITFNETLDYDSTNDEVKQAITNAIAKNWVVRFGGRTPTGA